MGFILRNNYVEQVWRVEYREKFFQWVLFIRGTEPEMQEYMESEIGYVGSYHAISDADIDRAKKLGFKIYLAPEL